ncbi:hypothetical protein NQZ68_018071 [Dissostichus eleginoides]|nr:hypothetical protein NQZ68_018071 [Dissostichus eleginoides]
MRISKLYACNLKPSETYLARRTPKRGFGFYQATLDTSAASEMAEKRTTRKRSISDQPISSEQSSPSSESAAPSDALSYRSMGQPLRFDGIKSSPSSESAAPSDALSYRSMGQPLRFDGIKSSPSSESAAPSDALSYRSMGQPLRFDGIKR